MRDFWAGHITPRELSALVMGLPPDGAFARALDVAREKGKQARDDDRADAMIARLRQREGAA